MDDRDVPSAGTATVAESEAPTQTTPGRWQRFRASGVTRFLVFKVGRAILVVLFATLITQWLLGLAPGGVSAAILGEAATPENIAQLNQELGLDRNFFVQYGDWATTALQGDLGRSPVTNESVWDAITRALPVTLELVALSLLIALTLAVSTALLAARRPGGLMDRFLGWVTSAGLSVPTFVLGPVLLYFFAVNNQIFPVSGWVPLSDGLSANLQSAILPAVCIAIPEFAVFQRLFRGDLVSTLQEDYIDAARARGISGPRIMARHAFRPASVSLMTVTGISIGRALGGTVVVEALFVLPGIGLLLQKSILNKDLIMVQGIVVFIALAYVFVNLAVDLLYAVVDPRLRGRTER